MSEIEKSMGMPATLSSSAAGLKEDSQHLFGHLALLPDRQWAVWRWVGVRGAGFPAAHVLNLSSPRSAASADELIHAEDEVERGRKAALNSLVRDLEKADGDARRRIEKTIRRLWKHALPEPLDVACPAQSELEAFRAAYARIESAQANFLRVLEIESARISEAIRDVARTDRFREAVIWQNRNALQGSINALLRMPVGDARRGAERQKREALIANYLQRYCTKNDTIGFFGPVGWARLVTKGEAVTVRPGPDLLAARNVYLEVWGVDALAEALNRDKSLLQWLAPRCMHFVHLQGTTLHTPSRSPVSLSAQQAAILHACDGERTAKQIAAELIRDQHLELKNETEVYGLLEQMRDNGLIAWTLEAPIELHPERSLRRLIERVEDESLRRPALEALTELTAARDAIAQAGGNAEQLDKAVGNLETTFTRLTGVQPTRSDGKNYAGRTLVYEDCRRDVEIDLGPELLESLGPPLSLLLTSARWFTFQTSRLFRKAFKEIYSEASRKIGSSQVDFATFWYRLHPLLFSERSPLVDKAFELFQQKWEAILSVPSNRQRVTYSSEELRPRVLETFAAPHGGWETARYHSPDVMIAASSPEAIRRGDYQLVLGELHVGFNTLSFSVFLAQHPSPEDLLLAIELDMSRPRLVPVIPKKFLPGQCGRLQPALVSSRDFHLMVAPEPCTVAKSKLLPMGSLVVEDAGDELAIRTRDGQLQFDIVEIFGIVLTSRLASSFKPLRPRAHSPRISFDRLTVCRESWTFSPSDVDFAYDKEGADRFVEARRWACEYGIPRFVFVKAPVEEKPIYVDFESPIYVDMFAKVVRRSSETDATDPLITLTEMLPTLEQTWLQEAEGRHYTSELRIVALDLATTPGPGVKSAPAL